jgi:hypothetical protein
MEVSKSDEKNCGMEAKKTKYAIRWRTGAWKQIRL